MQGTNIISAVFDSHSEAERAISQLRSAGIDNSAISVIGKHDGDHVSEQSGSGDHVSDGKEPASFIAKAAAGSGIGALLGVAALAIPGVGPLVAAGAIAEAAIGGAALTGTAVGAAAGGLSDLLSKHGVSREDSDYYGQRVNDGGIFVSVDTSRSNVNPSQIEDLLHRAGGHSAGRSKMSSTTASTTSTF
jgi:hypothetical protein